VVTYVYQNYFLISPFIFEYFHTDPCYFIHCYSASLIHNGFTCSVIRSFMLILTVFMYHPSSVISFVLSVDMLVSYACNI
jgi:hypothetical protein